MENKKRTLTIVLILMLSVSVVSFITSMVMGIIIDVNNANLKPYESTSVVTATPSEIYLKDSVINEVKNYQETKEVLTSGIDNTVFNSLMGSTSVPIYFISKQSNTQELMNVMGVKLTKGRLPHDRSHEVALQEDILISKKLKIGDYIGSDVQDDEILSGKYKIVGSLTGVAKIGFSSKSVISDAYEKAGINLVNKPRAIIVIPKTGELTMLNKKLDQIGKKNAKVYTYSSIQKIVNSQLGSMNTLLRIIIFVVVAILSVSVGAFVYIIYLGRSDEFGILHAIGYPKRFITRFILKELLALSVVCWMIGYAFSILMISALNYFLLAGKGLHLYLFTTSGFTNTLFIPVMVMICAAFPILYKFRKWDPIAVIERRD
jgi:ABC-type antimicrobial peptide transport system permease subunit